MTGNMPLRFLGVGNMLDREYRNSPTYQWARELAKNGIEASATTIEFSVEWQGVAATGVYRLQYADDGVGMDRLKLREYMATLGKGSKIVGGAHDNYALGGRMTTLPWNPLGVVVISVTNGEAQMVKMLFDPAAADGDGEYVLEEVEWVDEGGEVNRSTVYPPYFDDELGFDWADVIPDFITSAGHGTTFVLLGRDLAEDTLNGDSERGESIRFLTRKYFNTRFWELPNGITLRCIEFTRPDERAEWPKSSIDRKAYQFRTVKGAKSVAEHVRRDGTTTLESSGSLPLSDGTFAHWYLRVPEKVDTGGVGSSSGFIAVKYRDELYGHAYADIEDGDTRVGAAVFRQFGIGSDAVRRRLFVILEPPEFDEVGGTAGIAPSTGRADLYWVGPGVSPRSVKPADWSDEFAENMPPEIEEAIRKDFADSRGDDEDREERLKRVMERFSKRWRATRARAAAAGDTTTTPVAPGSAPRQPVDAPKAKRAPRGRKRVVVKGRAGSTEVGIKGSGTTPAATTKVTMGLPSYKWVTASDIADEGMIAAWQGHSKTYPSGCVQIDRDHPVIVEQVAHWTGQYPRAVSHQVEEIVLDAYADVAVAKVAHLHQLAGTVLSEERRDEMLKNPALSTAMLGLIAEDALISPRLGGLGAKKVKHLSTDAESPDDADAAGEEASDS